MLNSIFVLIEGPIIMCIISTIFIRYIGHKGIFKYIILNIFIYTTIGIVIGYIIYYKKLTIISNISSHIDIYNITVGYNYILDKYTIGMYNLVNIITITVLTYSNWYLKEEEHKLRFYVLMIYFYLAMQLLVLSNNYLILFYAWELVGLMSFLLISYWFNRILANKASFKAYSLNRLGDIGFYLLLFILIYYYGSPIYLQTFYYKTILFIYICMCVWTKSAVHPFNIWLTSAMEGPTPVSALLHAATMVCAGAYLLLKFPYLIYFNNMSYYILLIFLIYGLIYVNIISFYTRDIKKIIALSTGSQLILIILITYTGYNEYGYMHLISHGFFKGLLFLMAGIIIHNFNNIQYLTKYGSLIYYLPITYILIFSSLCSLSSVPSLSGFFTKEPIISLSTLSNTYLFTLLSVICTYVYSIYIWYYIFIVKPNSPKSYYSHIKEEYPISLYILLFVLFIPTVVFGYFYTSLFITEPLNEVYAPMYLFILLLLLYCIYIHKVIIAYILLYLIKIYLYIYPMVIIYYKYIYNTKFNKLYLEDRYFYIFNTKLWYKTINILTNINTSILELYTSLAVLRFVHTGKKETTYNLYVLFIIFTFLTILLYLYI